jgi:hypothetical protein
VHLDPREVRRKVEDLFGVTGRKADALFTWVHSQDPKELLKHNRWRKLYLARYARQSVLQWDDVPVAEIEAYVREIGDLLKRESELSRMSED